MLEEAPDDRFHANILADPFHTGPEAANPSHNQFDLYARLARFIELVDHRLIGDLVAFDPDRCRFARAGMGNLAVDREVQFVAQVKR